MADEYWRLSTRLGKRWPPHKLYFDRGGEAGGKGRYFSHSCQNRVIVILYDGGGVFVVEHIAYVM